MWLCALQPFHSKNHPSLIQCDILEKLYRCCPVTDTGFFSGMKYLAEDRFHEIPAKPRERGPKANVSSNHTRIEKIVSRTLMKDITFGFKAENQA